MCRNSALMFGCGVARGQERYAEAFEKSLVRCSSLSTLTPSTTTPEFANCFWNWFSEGIS